LKILVSKNKIVVKGFCMKILFMFIMILFTNKLLANNFKIPYVYDSYKIKSKNGDFPLMKNYDIFTSMGKK
jgi:hypothetical protein